MYSKTACLAAALVGSGWRYTSSVLTVAKRLSATGVEWVRHHATPGSSHCKVVGPVVNAPAALDARPSSPPLRTLRVDHFPSVVDIPVHLAHEWRSVMFAHGESRADLARRLGVSRAGYASPEHLESGSRCAGAVGAAHLTVAWFDLLHELGVSRAWLGGGEKERNRAITLLAMPEVTASRYDEVAKLLLPLADDPEWHGRLTWLVRRVSILHGELQRLFLRLL